ncbi:MAG TPA: ABC transporter substrate-binding protein [Thermotogota bacterium]|nr:ABC transporter substrate-binding protein [Thermotogota bacterium]HRW91960.1 ABC transporter substrate-binding protein [Thermotogota bacterium]
MKRFVQVFLVVMVVFGTMLVAQNMDEIKVAAVFSMTGGASGYGRMTWEGVEIAWEMYPEVLGIPIDVYLIDTKSDKVEAANGVRRAIENDGVLAILGNIISGNSLAGGAVAEELKTAMVSPTSTSPLVTEGKKFVNRVCFIDAFQGQAAAKLMQELGNQKVAVFMDVEQDYSVALARFFEDTFTQSGGEVLYEYFKTGDQDFSAQVLDAIAKGAEAFYLPGYYQEVALICLQAYQNGFYGDLVSADGADAPETVEIAGEAVEGLFLTANYHPDAPAFNENAEEFLAAYEKKYPGEKPAAFAGLGFDAYMVLLKAIEMAGEPDREKVAQAIRQIKDFPGATGYITINEQGNAEKTVTVVRIENGQFVYDSMINP